MDRVDWGDRFFLDGFQTLGMVLFVEIAFLKLKYEAVGHFLAIHRISIYDSSKGAKQWWRISGGELMKPSILRNIFVAYLAFGVFMGIIFPFFADFFVTRKPGLESGFVFACLAAGVVMGIATFQIMRVMLIKKLKKLSEVTFAISKKDLRNDIAMRSDDVIGELIDSFNVMSRNLRQMVIEMEKNCQAVHVTSCQVHVESSKTSDGADAQAQRIAEIRRLVNSINAAMTDIRTNTGNTQSLCSDAREQMRHTAAELTRTRQQVHRLDEKFQETVGAIQSLDAKTTLIAEAIDQIQSISGQTHILALNAAVQAAKAKEHGAGFSIVAVEVRNLASKTKTATVEIRAMIEALQSDSASTRLQVEKGQQQTKSTVEAIEGATSTLEAIVQGMQSIMKTATAIDSISGDQMVRLSQLVTETEIVHNIANANRQGAKESASGISNLQKQSRLLQSLFSGFKLQQ